MAALNPTVPQAARDDAVKQVVDLGTPVLLAANRQFHRLLVTGVPVQYQRDGETRGDFVRLVDWADAGAQRVAGGQPVLHHRAAPHAPARHHPVRQWPAAGADRAEEPGRPERRRLEGVPPDPDLQGRRSPTSSSTTRCW